MEITQIEIVEEISRDYFKAKVNKLSGELKAFATQTHIIQKIDHAVYVAFLFYKKNG